METRGYDAQDELTRDSVGAPGATPLTTLTAYDRDGNAVQTEQPDGDTVYDSYDLVDQLTAEEIDPAPVLHATGPSYSTYSYDAAGDVTRQTDADGRTQATVYDGDDRTVQAVDTYTSTAALTTTPQYDPDGNTPSTQVVTATAGSATTSTGYNAADWPITTTETSSDGTSPLTTAYGYDAAGQERTATILDGQTPVTTTLDPEGRAMSLAENADGTGPYTGTYGYYPTDLPMTASVPGGVQTHMWYDGSDRVTRVDLAGPLTATQPLSDTYAYGYDAATGWTTGMTWTVNGAITATQLTHDPQGRLIRWSGQPDGPESWGYDGNDNFITNTEYISGAVRQTVYTYSATIPNQEVQQHTDGLGVEYFGYDHNGNTTSLTSTDFLTDPSSTYAVSDTLRYDSEGRPVTIIVKNGQYTTKTDPVYSTVRFGYNAQGQRSSYAVSTPGEPGYRASYRYRDGGPQVAQAVVASGTVTGTVDYTDTYLYTQGGAPYELLRQYQGQPMQRYWYEVDGRNDVVALTDVNGNVVDRYAYDPWGEGLFTSEQVPQPLRYAGYWWDQELGWYWVNVRSYDPEGRWLQPDASEADGMRSYVYVNDDPIDLTDPLGLLGNPFSDPCNVWVVGYFCERDAKERARQYKKQSALFYFRNALALGGSFYLSGPKPPKQVINGNQEVKGEWGERQMDQLMRRLGYAKIGAKFEAQGQMTKAQGIDGVYQRLPSKTPAFGLPEFVFAESKFDWSRRQTTANGVEEFSDQWLADRLEAAVGPEKTAEIMRALRADSRNVVKLEFRWLTVGDSIDRTQEVNGGVRITVEEVDVEVFERRLSEY